MTLYDVASYILQHRERLMRDTAEHADGCGWKEAPRELWLDFYSDYVGVWLTSNLRLSYEEAMVFVEDHLLQSIILNLFNKVLS